jgi:hypothetical protein
MFDLFLDFDRLVKGRAQVEVETNRYQPLFRSLLGLGFM